jgi:hypothetical protein
MNVYTVVIQWYWQGKTEIFCENSIEISTTNPAAPGFVWWQQPTREFGDDFFKICHSDGVEK